MSNSTRYFQLTPDILVEYNYNSKSNVELNENTFVVNNTFCSSRTFFCKYDGSDYKNIENNFVLPLNSSESKFVQCETENGLIDWSEIDFSQITFVGTKKIECDTFRLHFTSRNYLGNNNYDGFIINVNVYDRNKNKVGLLSCYVKKTDDSNINDNPVLINQKLYTTYFDFIIPSISELLENKDEIRNSLFPNYDIMENTPIVVSIYGVKSTVELTTRGLAECYSTEKLNSIYIPTLDEKNNIEIKVKEAEDGDYFEIYPEVNNGKISFTDYISKISNDSPENYIIFYELSLIEYTENDLTGKTTHKEQHIINAVKQEASDGKANVSINEDELENIIFYRPVLKNNSSVDFRIEVKANIINTLDNTTIVVTGSGRCGSNPNKYGKRMNRINLGITPAQINVYNKRPDVDTDGVKLTNSSSNVKIENHQHSVIGFIECANVGVSIEQIPVEQLQ